MITYISLLRGINVGGHVKIKMPVLKELYAALGFTNIKSYIQSGNIVFDSAHVADAKLAIMIENSIAETFSFSVSVLLKRKNEFKKIMDNNPYLGQQAIDITKLHITFLSELPDKALLDKLSQKESGSDQFHIADDVIYLHCPNGYGRTKLTNAYFERTLKIKATTRNWRTASTLYEIANH